MRGAEDDDHAALKARLGFRYVLAAAAAVGDSGGDDGGERPGELETGVVAVPPYKDDIFGVRGGGGGAVVCVEVRGHRTTLDPEELGRCMGYKEDEGCCEEDVAEDAAENGEDTAEG